jgi:hypothetical protein
MNRTKALSVLSDGFDGYESYEGKLPKRYEGKLPNRYAGGFANRRQGFSGSEEGEVTFADEQQFAEDHQFAFTLTNTGTAAVARTIALCPAYFTHDQVNLMTDNRGNPIDAIVKEGIVIGTVAANNPLVCASENKPIDELLQFTRFNPTRFLGIKMQCANAAQFGQALNIKQVSPFRNLQDRTLIPDSYKSSLQYDATRVEIPLDNFQFDNNTIVAWKILAGTTVTITLFGGAILNIAMELDRKARIARNGLVRTFGPDYLNK